MSSNGSTASSRPGGHALVVGGSVTGLLAARVLTEHFDRVTLVERDRFPEIPEWRKGTPQARHVHVLLKQGERIMGRLFPALLAELRQAGAEVVDMSADTAWFYFGNWKTRFRSGMEMHCQSRGFLEWSMRRHLAGRKNLTILQEHDVTGIVTTTHVEGVTLRARSGAERLLATDLVVDASGRGTRTPQWLEAAGFVRPEESELRVDVGYASRCYSRPVNAPPDWKVLLVYPRIPETKLGVIVPIEGGRWMVTLVGWFGDHPPGDEQGFLEFAKELPVPDLYEAIRDAEPLSPIALHKFPSDLRRRYEWLPQMPDGLAVIGDALCSFNPIYGQGMTTGALGADTLGRCLAEARANGSLGRLEGFSTRFQRRLARVIDTPWLLTTTEDLRSPAAEGKRPRWVPLLHWYTAKVHRLTWSDEFVGRRFLEVMHLTETPAALFHPYIVWRALTLSA